MSNMNIGNITESDLSRQITLKPKAKFPFYVIYCHHLQKRNIPHGRDFHLIPFKDGALVSKFIIIYRLRKLLWSGEGRR